MFRKIDMHNSSYKTLKVVITGGIIPFFPSIVNERTGFPVKNILFFYTRACLLDKLSW